ncbi:hypothetical protein R1sor_018001 [Riccia sorocarpa]|uniref:Uncharacterized protein n=1 Tax=Riccia sorocarpa TaxID=122646 RepID=A0ABD3IEP6_9MARC
MCNAAECEAEEIKRRALEEADLIRSSARLSVEGTPGASTMVERNVEIEASMILRFAQTFASEARAEATKVLDDARDEAEQLLSSARADAGAIPSSCSALVGDKEKLRRERDALRKRMRTMKSLQPSSLGCSKLDLSVSTSIKDMRNTLQRVKSSRRTDYLAAKHNLILALAGDNVVTKRYQTSLARALGVKKKEFFQGCQGESCFRQ